MNGIKPPAGSHYFCRGCGDALPTGWHGQFHSECLKADKRRRIQEKRCQEKARFQAWLQRQRCPQCGAPLTKSPLPASRVLAECGSDRSHREGSWEMAAVPDSSD